MPLVVFNINVARFVVAQLLGLSAKRIETIALKHDGNELPYYEPKYKFIFEKYLRRRKK